MKYEEVGNLQQKDGWFRPEDGEVAKAPRRAAAPTPKDDERAVAPTLEDGDTAKAPRRSAALTPEPEKALGEGAAARRLPHLD